MLLGKDHFDSLNPWGQPVVGWSPICQGEGGLYNPRGFALLRIVLHKLIEGDSWPLYDQPILVENPGSIVIAQYGDRIGMIRNFRMVGERLIPDAGADYVRRLEEERRWMELVESLGSWRWECPRGLIPPGVSQDPKGETLEAFIVRTAKLEALEEAGLEIEDARIAGRVNVNPTFFPHAQYVVHAQVKSVGKASPEDLEMIGECKLFTLAELRAMNDAGEFDDGLTMAALALFGMAL